MHGVGGARGVRGAMREQDTRASTSAGWCQMMLDASLSTSRTLAQARWCWIVLDGAG